MTDTLDRLVPSFPGYRNLDAATETAASGDRAARIVSTSVGESWRLRTTAETPLPTVIRDLVDGHFTIDRDHNQPVLLRALGITTEWFDLQASQPNLVHVTVSHQTSTGPLLQLLEQIRDRGGIADAETHLLDGGASRYLVAFWLVFADFPSRPSVTGWGDLFDVNRDGNTLTFQPLPQIGGRG